MSGLHLVKSLVSPYGKLLVLGRFTLSQLSARMCVNNCPALTFCPGFQKLSFTTSIALRKTSEQNKTGKELDIKRQSPYEGLTTGQKVKEAGKDASYIGIIVTGVLLLGGVGYFLGRELFSSDSVNGVYSRSLKLCKQNDEVVDCVGEPIKGYGETTRRGRRRHCSHMEFMSGGVQHMRMQFYIEGPIRKGTVHVEVFKDSSGHYQYKYLLVELEGYPRRQIVVEGSV